MEKSDSEKLKELQRRRAFLRSKDSFDNDFYLFSKYICRKKDMAEIPHREMCDIIHPRDENLEGRCTLYLVPRGTFKTSLGTESYPLFRLQKNPYLRILIGSAVWDNSRTMLSGIKQTLEYGKKFRKYYGDWIPPRYKGNWNKDNITIAPRVKWMEENQIFEKEPSIVTGGADSCKVSFHFDIMIFDDLHNKENTNTREQINKVRDFFTLCIPLLEDPSKGEILVLGTRWDELDLYGHIIEEMLDYRVLVRDCYGKVVYQRHPIKKYFDFEAGLFFPDRFNHGVLQKIKDDMPASQFHCQYLNSPVPESERRFSNEHRNYIKPEEYEFSDRVSVLDTAYGTKQESDFSAITVVDRCMEGRFVCIFAKHYKLKPNDFINEIFRVVILYKIKKVGIERVTSGIRLEQDLKEEMVKRGYFFRIIALKRRGMSKNDRIIDYLQAKWEADSVFFLKNYDYKDLFHEMETFPKGRVDDIIECLADSVHLLSFRGKKREKIKRIWKGNKWTGAVPVALNKDGIPKFKTVRYGRYSVG